MFSCLVIRDGCTLGLFGYKTSSIQLKIESSFALMALAVITINNSSRPDFLITYFSIPHGHAWGEAQCKFKLSEFATDFTENCVLPGNDITTWQNSSLLCVIHNTTLKYLWDLTYQRVTLSFRDMAHITYLNAFYFLVFNHLYCLYFHIW